jgi:hypothetical protein
LPILLGFLQHARVNTRLPLPWLLALAAMGCARPQQAQLPAYFWPAPSAEPVSISPGQEALPAPAPTDSGSPILAKIDPQPRPAVAALPGGDACVSLLGQRGVAFSRRQGERGVATPVLVKGAIGGVKFFSDATPFIADCRLVLALSEIAPELAAMGVTQARFSGAYVYRVKTTGSGRLSLHAYGLAIDVHDVWFGSERLNVKVNFTKGLGRDCQPNLPRLNNLVCHIRERRLFKELLTPDDNADHHDHFHFGLEPLPGEIPPEPPPVILHKPVRKIEAGVPREEKPAHDEHELEKEEPKTPKAKTEELKTAKAKGEQPKTAKAKAEEHKRAKAEEPRGAKTKSDERKTAKGEKSKHETERKAPPVEENDDEIPPIESELPQAPGSLPEMAPEHG